MAETALDTVVPVFGFPCMSTEAPLRGWFSQEE